jgi:hypothetical protein
MSTTSEALKAILSDVPAGTKTYALMDCSLDSTLYPAIIKSGCPLIGLYREPWQKKLGEIAPHLVELETGSPFYRELVSWDWYGNWGYFVQSGASLDDLGAALAPLTLATAPNGQQVFFRFFDPRVLRPFLSAATKTDIELLFTTATRFVVPMLDDGLQGEGAINYTAQDGALQRVERRFGE